MPPIDTPVLEPEPQRAFRPGAPCRRLFLAALAGWSLLSLASLAAGDAVGIAWSGVVLGVVVGAVWAAAVPVVRRIGALAIAAYALGLTALTLAVGWWGGDAGRVQVLTGNPNVLAAALVTAFTAWAALAPSQRWVWWGWLPVALAVLHTGSRTAGAALLAAAAVWLVVLLLRRHARLRWAPVVALAFLALAAYAWQRGVVEITPNLLAAPSDLSDPAWRHGHAERVIVDDSDAPGPYPGTRAQRLVATARPDGVLLVLQSLGTSEAGVPYVASVYARADTPHELVLTSHLASVTCLVGSEWQRCVTPVGYGDDRSQRQLQLRAPERGGSVDLELFGAQYERGTEATPFVDARPAWIPQPMVNRFDLRRVTFLPASRLIAWRAGVALFLERPWFGVGLSAAPEAFVAATAAPITYAHHVLVQWLAVHGVVGTLGIALVLVALALALRAPAWARLAPMLVALALLNTWDVTLLEPTVFGAALIAVAAWTRGGVPWRVPDRYATG